MMFLRSLIFNLFFYTGTALIAVAILPAALLPMRAYLMAIKAYMGFITLLERNILKLNYTIEGLEHLPEDGRYIVGMKHYSAYETLKLHALFDHPAIILKKELMWIPVWGWHASKLHMIPVDRQAKGSVLQDMIEHAKRILSKEPNRPVVIFPQGTRVAPEATLEERPYKIGIIRLYEALDRPIVPVAVNSGYFWGRNSFLKRPGTVTFKILPPIPAGQAGEDVLQQLSDQVESHSATLMQQAAEQTPPETGPFRLLAMTLFCLALLWGGFWVSCADQLRDHIDHWTTQAEESGIAVRHDEIRISGFPGPLHVQISNIQLSSLAGKASIPMIRASALPVPGASITLSIPQGIEANPNPIPVQRFDLEITGLITWPGQDVSRVDVNRSHIDASPLLITSQGAMTLDDQGLYQGTLTHDIVGVGAFIETLVGQGLINRTIGLLIRNWIEQNGSEEENAEAQKTSITTPVKDGWLMIGPFRIFQIPERV